MKNNPSIIFLPTSSLIPNKTKLDMYQVPENYDLIKSNIKEHGIIEPLIVNKETNVLISGNLRLQIAIELNIEKVPVIFKELEEKEMDIKSISTNQTRIKSYFEILKEIQFFEEHYKVKKGARTDLDPKLKEIKEKRDKFLKSVSRDTRDKVKMIDQLGTTL